MFENLRQRAIKYIEEHQGEFDRLKENGITKNALSEGRKESQLVVTYPPSGIMKEPSPTYDLYNETSPQPDEREKAVLYVHIPFCKDICSYCAYARTASRENDPRYDEYLNYLEQEAGLHRDKLGGDKIPVESIYIGGGTPTQLSEEQLKRLYKIIDTHFQLTEGGEYSLEGNPMSITEQKVRDAVENGVNRISFGAESFVDEMLEGVNRHHGKAGIFQALENIRKGGIKDIDIDMIRGLVGFRREPQQGHRAITYNDEMLLEDLQSIQESGIPSITSYQYTIKPKSLNYMLFQQTATGRTAGPGENAIAAKQLIDDYKQYVSSGEALIHHVMFKLGMEELGYKHAAPTVDWFTLEGSGYYKHNYQKWGLSYNLIGLGQGSYGYVEGHQYINHENGKDYADSVMRGRLPVHKAIDLSPEEQMRRRFLFGLKSEVDVKRFIEKHHIDPIDSPFGDTIKEMMQIGAIEKTSEGNYKLTEVAQFAADWVMMKFYSPEINKQIEQSTTVARKAA